jgi:hypothetical protein
MSTQDAAILMTVVVHVMAIPVLFWALLQGSGGIGDVRRWWNGDDDGDDLWPEDEPVRPAGGGVPLPDAEQAPVRLRGPRRLRDHRVRPARRPAHPPGREPARTPERL